VNGPEGGGMSLLTLKRLVKKMIDEEDHKPALPTIRLRRSGGRGNSRPRRTVAKYREDMRIPSTHQRRVKSEQPPTVKPRPTRESRQLFIPTGLSGPVKAQFSTAFEDMGFYCVDNLPV